MVRTRFFFKLKKKNGEKEWNTWKNNCFVFQRKHENKKRTRKKNEKKNENEGRYEHFFTVFTFLDGWMIYCVVFLYALLNCCSCCCCNFIGQVGIRTGARLYDCYRLRNQNGWILRKTKAKFFHIDTLV